MANRNYHCIQDDGSHLFGIRRKARHHREQNSKYFMLASYGAQASRSLRVHSPRVLTPRHVLSHREQREIHRKFIHDPLQALNVKKNPIAFLKFQPRYTTNFKGWYTYDNAMLHKRQ